MSLRHGAVVVLPAVLAALGFVSCTSTPTTTVDSGRVDCPFVNDDKNCWRTFVRSVDRCLGQSDAGFYAAQGLLDDSGLGCTYASRTIAATGQALDLPQSESDPLARAFTVVQGGRTCLEMRQWGKSVTLVSEGTTLAWKSEDHTFTLTCGDGRVLQGDTSELLECVTAAGGLPGYAYSNTATTAWFTLLGMNGPVYDCARADAADGG